MEWVLSAATCVTRGFDSFSMSGWYPAMTNRTDAKLLQVLVRQARENRLVYLIFAECSLILPEAQAPQPDHNVHDGARNQWWRVSSCSRESVSRDARQREDDQEAKARGQAF